MKVFIITAFRKDTIFISLKVSLIVGLILNLINQGSAIFNLDFNQLSYWKILLTFIVPYLVSTYSATMAKLSFQIGKISPINTHIKCKHCNKNNIYVKRDQIIPVCPECLEHTNWERPT